MPGELPPDNKENPPKEVAGQSAASAQVSISSLWRRLRRRAYQCWPTLFDDPDLPSLIAEFANRDPEENRQSAPPVQESIELHSLWVIEVYPPSYVNGLMSALKMLGWDAEDPARPDSNPVRWLRNVRQRSANGAWFNIGPLVRPGDDRFFAIRQNAPLPAGVGYAIAQMYNVTSSITCVVVGFVFTDDVARQYDATLRQPRTTFAEKRGRGHQFHSPTFQKRDAIRKIRKEWQERCANWFRDNLPGLFASGLLEGQFPTCEFISLQEQTPFLPSQAGHRRPEYLRLLGIDSDIDAWVSDDLPGFRLGRPAFIDQGEEFNLIVAVKHSDIPSDAGLEAYGGRNREGYVNYLNRRVDGLLTRWAVRAMLEGYERVVNGTRDAIPPDATSTSEALKFLGFLRKILNTSTDLVAVSSDLVDYSQCRRRFGYDVADFRPVNPRFAGGESTLVESLRLMISERAGWLRRTDDSVRHLLSQYGTVQSTLANLQLQHHVKGLTWLILLLTVATLAIGIVGLLRGP